MTDSVPLTERYAENRRRGLLPWLLPMLGYPGVIWRQRVLVHNFFRRELLVLGLELRQLAVQLPLLDLHPDQPDRPRPEQDQRDEAYAKEPTRPFFHRVPA